MSQRSVVNQAKKHLAHYNKEKEIDESRGPKECAELFIDAYVDRLNTSIRHNAKCGSSVSELTIDLGYIGGACVQKCEDPVFRNVTARFIINKLEDKYGSQVKYEGSTRSSADQYYIGDGCENSMDFNIDISLEPKK